MLTALVRPPLLSAESDGVLYDNLLDFSTGNYSHSSSATVGYDKMDMEIIVPDAESRNWITHGLGRHIEVHGSSGIVWEGFVNEVTIATGNTTLKVGPLLDISNRIKVAYTTKRWNTNPPIGGDPAETSFSSNTDSLSRWGTFEQVISGGEGVAATMEAMRDSKLNELSWPKVGQDFSSAGTGMGSISISCFGYYHYLKRYLMNDNEADTGVVAISAKLADALNADPDGLFSSSNANIETNALEVPSFDGGNRTGLDVIQELIGLGFASGERALFSVGPGRYVRYRSQAVDNSFKYVYNMYDKSAPLTLYDGTPIKIWDIQPGEWVIVESLTAKPFSSSLPRHSDPKYMFIESINVQLPNSISIQGGLGGTLKEKVAALGVGFTRG